MCVCWGGGAVKNNTALHETLSGKLKRKQSSLKPFAVWIFCGSYYPSEYLSPYIMEFLGSCDSDHFKHAKGRCIAQIPPKRSRKLP